MKQKTKRLIALFMAVIMLLGSAVTALAADDAGAAGTVGSDAGAKPQKKALALDLMTYSEYRSRNGYIDEDDDNYVEPEAVEYKVDLGDFVTYDIVKFLDDGTIEENEKAIAEIKKYNGDECFVSDGQTDVTWKVKVDKAGWYTVSFDYCAYTPEGARVTTDAIERVLLLDGAAQYEEARFLSLPKTWVPSNAAETDRNSAFERDTIGNEKKPTNSIYYVWDEYTLRDYRGYYTEDLMFYFDVTEENGGEHYITLQGIREYAAIKNLRIHTPEKLPSYKEYLKKYDGKGPAQGENTTVKLEAEMPAAVNSAIMFPIYDRSSSITSPQHYSNILYNTMGGDKWTSSGQWISYNFTPQASGFYDIVLRYRQDEVGGMYTSRSLKINGEYPFAEAKLLRFDYNSDWQASALTDGNATFQIYFEAGKTYNLEFEVTLGNMSDIVRRVNEIIDSLNADYMAILQLTGNQPDENRDYGLARIMPQTIADLGRQANNLYDTVDYISEMNGIKSENTSTLEQAAVLIERMASDESEIAMNLGTLKEWISSLGTWLGNSTNQFLEVDYILIQPAGSELPQAKDSAWQAIVFEVQKFFVSFYADYNSLGGGEGSGDPIEVWTSSGRDQAQIIKNIINDKFAGPNNASVRLKLTAGGTLLPSILAGVGPDVSIDATSPIEMAIRGAILPLNDYEGFEEVMKRFPESSRLPLTLYGVTYAIPVSQGAPIMFCRDDILQQLELNAPRTWDEMMALVPVLQFNNMEIGMSMAYDMYLYQSGGTYWRNEGMATNLDSSHALDAFEYMCNMFTQYSLPVSFDATNRFKTGEMPIFLGDYATYNTLTVFAPEIAGLWSIQEIPGSVIADATIGEDGKAYKDGEVLFGSKVIEDEHGNQQVVVNSGSSIAAGVIIPRGCVNDQLAWKFVDWYTDKDFQVDFFNGMVELLGPSGKQAVSNLEAFEELPWTEEEKAILLASLKNSYAIQSYPGDYFIGRYTSFAFNSAYNEGADPSDELLTYISTINKEITRKRKEFDLMITEEWNAIAAYNNFTGDDAFNQWKYYWAKEILGFDADKIDLDDAGLRNTDGTLNNSYIKDAEEYEYTFKDYMKDKGITVESFEDYEKEVGEGKTTLSYKEWLGK